MFLKIFGQPQTYSQSLLGSGQQNYTQINQLNNPLQPNNVMTSQLNNQLTNQISAPLNSQLTTPINDSLTNQNVGQLDAQMFTANSFQIQVCIYSIFSLTPMKEKHFEYI